MSEKHILQERWGQLQRERPPITDARLIVDFFQRKLRLLVEFQKAGIHKIEGEKHTVMESLDDLADTLRIMGHPPGNGQP